MAAAGRTEVGQEPSGGVVPFKLDYTASREMAIRAGRYVRRARDAHIFLTYSDATLGPAEDFGLELWGMLPGGLTDDETDELRRRLILELGAYFGETLIHNHGGIWGWATIGGRRVFALRTSSGFTVFPTHKARKRLWGQEPESIVSVYSFLSRWPPLKQSRR
ncbi:MAG: hypothetical protein ACHQ01_06595 [Candidatus Limnocylindrales bacterium]